MGRSRKIQLKKFDFKPKAAKTLVNLKVYTYMICTFVQSTDRQTSPFLDFLCSTHPLWKLNICTFVKMKT